MATKEQVYCPKCEKTMNNDNFYKKKSGEYMIPCKNCLTMHVDNFDPETFTWILKELDVPYIPERWNSLRNQAFEKNPKLNGMSVIGRYLSTMKLKQWKKYGWADTEQLVAEAEEKKRAYESKHPEAEDEAARLKAMYEAGEIPEAQYKTMISTVAQKAEMENNPNYLAALAGGANTAMYGVAQDQIYMKQNELPDPAAELTQEDKIYLAMKWGRFYQPNEWVELEKLYSEYMDSFDIQEVDTKNNVLLICKTFHKMNKALDDGDYSSYTSLNRTYESLRKTAKLTAAQNKEQKDSFVDSVGEIVAMCEKEGFIPRYCTDIPQDKVDMTLKDQKEYLYKLVTEDLGFGQQIDMYLKKIEIQKEIEAAEETPDEEYYSEEAYEDYIKDIEEQREADLAVIQEEEEGEE